VLVPVKDFRQAKARLAGHLSPEQRHQLARTMATRVLIAAASWPVYVVCDDPAVQRFAETAGATPIVRKGYGLNGAVTSAVDLLAARHIDRVIVIHSDVPLASATSLTALAHGPYVTLVPDRREDGTNVVVVPAAAGFRFSYGAGSFRKHVAEATRLGLAVRVVRSRELGWDVDVPDDLLHPLVSDLLPDTVPDAAPAPATASATFEEGSPPSLPTSPASRP
jgi:2-phospho-L-lactate guanylyltransferase